MALLERREPSRFPSLNISLGQTLTQVSSKPCMDLRVPINNWPIGVACCPNCRHELQVSLAPYDGKPCCPQTPTLKPTFLPHSMLYSTLFPPLLPSPYYGLQDTVNALRLSGWYYGSLDWQGARKLLQDVGVGAFIIRDSGDRNFIFSLSVQTERGPTSVRLHYENGYFSLDCDRPLARYMPRFRCVVELIEHYTKMSEKGAAGTIWVDRDGYPHSPVLLKTPLRDSPPSLLHSARLALHRALNSNPATPKLHNAPKHRLLPLPSTLLEFLGKYPYSI